jgi:hypothetical protein
MNNIQRRRVTLLHRSCMSCDGLDQDFGREKRAARFSLPIVLATGGLSHTAHETKLLPNGAFAFILSILRQNTGPGRQGLEV